MLLVLYFYTFFIDLLNRLGLLFRFILFLNLLNRYNLFLRFFFLLNQLNWLKLLFRFNFFLYDLYWLKLLFELYFRFFLFISSKLFFRFHFGLNLLGLRLRLKFKLFIFLELFNNLRLLFRLNFRFNLFLHRFRLLIRINFCLGLKYLFQSFIGFIQRVSFILANYENCFHIPPYADVVSVLNSSNLINFMFCFLLLLKLLAFVLHSFLLKPFDRLISLIASHFYVDYFQPNWLIQF